MNKKKFFQNCCLFLIAAPIGLLAGAGMIFGMFLFLL